MIQKLDVPANGALIGAASLKGERGFELSTFEAFPPKKRGFLALCQYGPNPTREEAFPEPVTL